MNAITDKLNELEQAIAQLQQAGPQAAAEVQRLTERLERLRAAAATATPTRPGPGPATAIMPASAPSPARMPGVPAGGEQPGGLSGRSGPVPVAIASSVPVDVRLLGGLGQQRQNAEASYYFSRQASQQANAAVQVRAMQQAPLSVVRIESPLPLPVTGQGGGGQGGGQGGQAPTFRPGPPRSGPDPQRTITAKRQRQSLFPAANAALSAQLRLYQQIGSAQSGMDGGRVSAMYSAMGAGIARLGDQVGQAATSFQGLGAAATTVWQRGSSAILSLVAAADPFSTWPTYQDSITGLAISLGQVFLPYVDMASLGIQRLTKWFNSLSAEMKGSIGIGAASAVALAGIAYAGYRVVLAFQAVATGARVAYIAIMATTGPIGVLLAITGAVAALAATWYTVGRAVDSAKGKMDGAGGVGAGGSNQGAPEKRKLLSFTSADLNTLPTKERLALAAAGNNREQATQVLSGYRGQKADEYNAARLQNLQAVTKGEVIDRDIQAIMMDVASQYRRGREMSSLKPKDHPKDKTPLEDYVATVGNEQAAYRAAQGVAFGRVSNLLNQGQTGGKEAPELYKELSREMQDQIKFSFQQNMYKDLLAGGNTKYAQQVFRDMFSEKKLQGMKAEVERIDALAEKVGVSITGAGQPQETELQRSLRGLPKAQIMTGTAYADQIQVASMEPQDLAAANRQEQLRTLKQSGELLKDVKEEIQKLQTIMDNPRYYRR